MSTRKPFQYFCSNIQLHLKEMFVTRCTVINGRPGGGGLKIFLEPCMDYKIYCGLKYASYLHVIIAPKSWQGTRLHPRFWEYGIHSSAVWFEMKDPCPDQRNSTVLNWRGKVMDDWSLDPPPFASKNIHLTPEKFWIRTCILIS